jgi:hypothetical protein
MKRLLSGELTPFGRGWRRWDPNSCFRKERCAACTSVGMQSKPKDRATQTNTSAFFKGTTGSASVYIRSYTNTALSPGRKARMPTQMV